MLKYYCFADRTIRVSSLYDEVHKVCRLYEIPATDNVDIDVVITQEDIDLEQSKSEIVYRTNRGSILENLAVYRKISEKMPYFDTFLMHGSVVSVDGVAYMFTAKSGTGKSTHAKLWCDLLGERAVMVNDDKPLISLASGKPVVYGTPYNGKHDRGRNISCPLKAICVIEQAPDNSIIPLTRKDVYSMLIQQIYRPSDKEAYARTLTLIDKMTESVSFYKLFCNMDIEAAKVAYEAMR